jgi:TolB protein
VRAILTRDLEYSDEFELITLPFGDNLVLRTAPAGNGGGPGEGLGEAFVNYPLYAELGADFAVNVSAHVTDSVPVVTLFNVRGEAIQEQFTLARWSPEEPEFRLEVHRTADRVVRAVTGQLGIAATRLLFVNRARVYRIDYDGAGVLPVSPQDVEAMSPAWAPDGRSMIYMQFPGRLYKHDFRTADRSVIPVTTEHQNFTPVFSSDGRTLAFSRASEDGTHVYTYNLADECCLQRLTVSRLYDNLSPTFSPDGRRIAFVSDRPGLAQIYVMAADGTEQELFAPFDWGVTGSSNAPEWSPDGLHLAFHREVAGVPQVFVMDVASRDVRQLTSAGRNYDPTWAPDGRHLGFVSERTGSRQVWIIDIETGRVRQGLKCPSNVWRSAEQLISWGNNATDRSSLRWVCRCPRRVRLWWWTATGAATATGQPGLYRRRQSGP